MTDLVAWLHRNADDCEDQSRWATPELAPFLREAATALEAKAKEIEALRADLNIVEGVFTDVCDELGCKYDNESALEAVATLRRERDEARAALKPFSDAADSLSDDDLDRMDLWESPAGMDITAGHLRAARAIMED